MRDHRHVARVGSAVGGSKQTVHQPQRAAEPKRGWRLRTTVLAVCLLLRWYGMGAAQGPSLSLSHPVAPDGEALLAATSAQDTAPVPLRPLIDGWGRLRAQLSDHGIQPALIYNGAGFADRSPRRPRHG